MLVEERTDEIDRPEPSEQDELAAYGFGEVGPGAPEEDLVAPAVQAERPTPPAPTVEEPPARTGQRGPQTAVEREHELQAMYDAEVDERREEHDEAVAELRQRVHELHEEVRSHRLPPEVAHERAEDLVDRFADGEEGRVLRELLPRWGGAETLREKLMLLVLPAVQFDRKGRLRYWTESQFDLLYRDHFGGRIEERFQGEEQDIPSRVSKELEHEGFGLDASDRRPSAPSDAG